MVSVVVVSDGGILVASPRNEGNGSGVAERAAQPVNTI